MDFVSTGFRSAKHSTLQANGAARVASGGTVEQIFSLSHAGGTAKKSLEMLRPQPQPFDRFWEALFILSSFRDNRIV